jgi:hypothetical protein
LAQELAVESDNDGRSRLLRRFYHPLQRLEIPAFEIADRVLAPLRVAHQSTDLFQWHM